MSAEMVAPAWMHTQISAEQYDSWSEEQCAGIEIVDGMVVVSPSASNGTSGWRGSWPTPWPPARARTGMRTRASTSARRTFRSPTASQTSSSAARRLSTSRPPVPSTYC